MAPKGVNGLGGSSGLRFPSPLRYPGGKGKIANYLKLLLLENDLLGTTYVEPYAGGAGAALSLLFEEYVDEIHINDIDPGISAFWRSILNETEPLVDRIASVELSMREWERQREVQRTGGTDLEIGFSTFFLNRTNRSGIITGGPIGGTEQQGKWSLDARFNRTDLIRRVQKIARFRSRIKVSECDALEVLDHYDRPGDHALVYADPPYFVRGGDLYRNFYEPEDHARVASRIQSLRCHWIVSYDNVQDVRDLFVGLGSVDYSLSYSAAARYRGSEVLYFSKGLEAPSVDSPAGIPSGFVRERLRSRRQLPTS